MTSSMTEVNVKRKRKLPMNELPPPKSISSTGEPGSVVSVKTKGGTAGDSNVDRHFEVMKADKGDKETDG